MKNSIDLVESDTSSISISTYSNLSNQSNSNSKNLNLNDLTSPQIKSPRHKLNRRSPSTYHLKNQSELNLFEKIVSQASMDESVYQLKDSSTDRGPMPRASLLMENFVYLIGSFLGVGIQSISYYFFPQFEWNIFGSFIFYIATFFFVIGNHINKIRERCVLLGTFDEKYSGRDRCPDNAVRSLAIANISTPGFRIGIGFYFNDGWNSNLKPWNQFSWTYPARLFLFFAVLDLAFYTYHRACHEIPFLWKIHQKHHSTKHPSPALGILADDWQEVIEIAIIPLIAILVIPLTFHEYMVSVIYLVQVEIAGHSGIRIYLPNPILHAVLQPLNMDLIIEDHDLHHRFGKGQNYGKATRIWDTIFGTRGERLECRDM